MTDIFNLIDRVTFETSTYCNYAKIHPKCPAHDEKSVRNISSSVVIKVLNYFGSKNFSGIFAWHQYNEPLVDPRLFGFIMMAKQKCPNSKILVWTNGSNLDQTLVTELEKIGVTNLIVTSYFDKEKLESFTADKMTYQVFPVGWVDVTDVYDRQEHNISAPCYAPLTDLTITVDGKIGLCCRDFDRRNVFADLNTASVEEALVNSKLLETYQQLSSGQRCLDICKRCTIFRDWRSTKSKENFTVSYLPSITDKNK